MLLNDYLNDRYWPKADILKHPFSDSILGIRLWIYNPRSRSDAGEAVTNPRDLAGIESHRLPPIYKETDELTFHKYLRIF